MEKIVLATNNKHKLKEYRKILTDYEVISLDDIGYTEDIVEDADTFVDNAFIKARTVHNYLKEKGLDYIVAGEDGGLCVDALDGAPGVYSARYSGTHGNDKANRAKLLKELEGKKRDAYFTCTIAVVYPDGREKHFEGRTYGVITEEEIGDTSFGYDCVFYSNDLNKVFGESTEEEKNSVSHRGRAIEEMLKGI
jgi:XTP/dITP diphosphohydrolase